MLLSRYCEPLKKAKTARVLGDSAVFSSEFVDSCVAPFEQMMKTKAAEVCAKSSRGKAAAGGGSGAAQAAAADDDDDDDDDYDSGRGRSKKGGGSSKGKKGGKGGKGGGAASAAAAAADNDDDDDDWSTSKKKKKGGECGGVWEGRGWRWGSHRIFHFHCMAQGDAVAAVAEVVGEEVVVVATVVGAPTTSATARRSLRFWMPMRSARCWPRVC